MKVDTVQHIQQLELLGYSAEETIFYRLFEGKGFGEKNAVNHSRKFPYVAKSHADTKGLYFVVNGQGTKAENIKTCRAFFAEWDDRPISEQLEAWKDKGFLEPTFQVQTRKSVHCYWVLEQPIPADEWRITQANLINFFDADKQLKDPCRVLRVAGAWHVEAGKEPIQCQLINVTGKKYTFEYFSGAIGEAKSVEKINKSTPKPKPKITDVPINDLERDRQLALDILSQLPPTTPGTGTYPEYREIAVALKNIFGESEAIMMMEGHSGDRQWHQIIPSSTGDFSIKTLVHHARRIISGWDYPQWWKDSMKKVAVTTSTPLQEPRPYDGEGEKVTKLATIDTSIVPPVPLINCLPIRDRNLINNGPGEKPKDKAAQSLAKDLISTEAYLKSEGISYADDAKGLFLFFCKEWDSSGDSLQWDYVWKIAEETAPAKPPLDAEKINSCLRKWAKDNGQKLPLTPVLTSTPLAIPQPETARVYGGTKTLTSGELARFLEDNVASRLALDDLRSEILLDGTRLSLSNDIKFWFLKNFGEVASKEDILDGLTYYARQNAFNPLERYLTALACPPIPIHNLAHRYFGQEGIIYNRMVEMWLISCVARALTPLDDPNLEGTQVDHTLILQSDQGKYKSTWFKMLGGKWHNDSIKDIEATNSLMMLHSNWIVELAELDRITSKKATGALKHWLTQRCDQYRKPYDRTLQPNTPRRCAFCGTVNPEAFLIDDENRRFWIVPVHDSIEKIDFKLLEKERDGIWLAAYNAYKAGQQWWPTTEESKEINQLNKKYKEEDAWQESIAPFLLDKEYVSAYQVLIDCLKFDPHQIKRADEMRVNKILDNLGWNKTHRKEITDHLTGKKVQRRVRLSPDNSSNFNKGWIVGKSQVEQDIQSCQPVLEVGKVGNSQEAGSPSNLSGCQPTLPTLATVETPSHQGFCQPANLDQPVSHTFPAEKLTKEEIFDLKKELDTYTPQLGWDSAQLTEFVKTHFDGKTTPSQLTVAEGECLIHLLIALVANAQT